jgi:hypothetical protein
MMAFYSGASLTVTQALKLTLGIGLAYVVVRELGSWLAYRRRLRARARTPLSWDSWDHLSVDQEQPSRRLSTREVLVPRANVPNACCFTSLAAWRAICAESLAVATVCVERLRLLQTAGDSYNAALGAHELVKLADNETGLHTVCVFPDESNVMASGKEAWSQLRRLASEVRQGCRPRAGFLLLFVPFPAWVADKSPRLIALSRLLGPSSHCVLAVLERGADGPTWLVVDDALLPGEHCAIDFTSEALFLATLRPVWGGTLARTAAKFARDRALNLLEGALRLGDT